MSGPTAPGVCIDPPMVPTQTSVFEPIARSNVPVPADCEFKTYHPVVQPVPEAIWMQFPGPCVVDVNAGDAVPVVVPVRVMVIEVPEP